MGKKEKQTILIVDDDKATRTLLSGVLGEYNVITAKNGHKALERAGDGNNMPDIILLDVTMPGMDGYEVCKQLKTNPGTKDIPVIFLTISGEPKLVVHGLGIGAVDYITKPFRADIVKARVETHLELKKHRDHLEQLVRERTQEIEDTQKEIIFMLGDIVETRSGLTVNHVKRVSELIFLLAKIAGIKDDEAEILRMAAPMLDIGKIGIPDAILNKQGKLTMEERAIIEYHPKIGYDILKKSNRRISKTAAIIAHQHHERWDGKGYPQGLKGEDIHFYARIAAVADVFDSLATKRCYRDAWTKEEIIEEFKGQRGKILDPELTDLLLNSIDECFAILRKYPDKD